MNRQIEQRIAAQDQIIDDLRRELALRNQEITNLMAKESDRYRKSGESNEK